MPITERLDIRDILPPSAELQVEDFVIAFAFDSREEDDAVFVDIRQSYPAPSDRLRLLLSETPSFLENAAWKSLKKEQRAYLEIYTPTLAAFAKLHRRTKQSQQAHEMLRARLYTILCRNGCTEAEIKIGARDDELLKLVEKLAEEAQKTTCS